MNRTIIELSRRNRELEHLLFREQDKQSADNFKELSSKELLSILQQLQLEIVKAQDPTESPLAHFDLISAIYRKLTKDREYHIPDRIKSSLLLTELSFQYLNGVTEEHGEINRLMQLLAISWAQLSVHDPEFLQTTQHPSKVVLSKLLLLGECWDHRSGHLAKKLLDGMKLVLSQLNNKGANPKLYEQASSRIQSLEQAFNEYRTKRLKSIVEEKRMAERERKAEVVVNEYISEKTGGEEFPIFLLEFLENYLSPHLKSIFMETGPVGQRWHQAIEDSDVLIWSITAPFNKEFSDEYSKKVQTALKRLYDDLDKAFPENTGLQDFFLELEDIHIKKLSGERVDFHSLITSPMFVDTNPEDEVLVAKDYSKELDEVLNDDDWYYLIQKGKRFRCQLVPRDYTGRWIVFVNLSGAKIAEYDITASSFHPSQLPLVTIDTHNYWEDLTAHLQRLLERRVKVLEEQYASYQEEVKADQARKQAAEEHARSVIREKIEEELQRQQKKKQAVEEERARALAKAKEEEAQQEAARVKAQKLVDDLMPGAKIKYDTEVKAHQLLILSIISTTTNKFIFTDQRGQRVLDPKEAELVNLFAAGILTLLEQGKEFEDTLQSLVAGQREALRDQ